MYTGAMLGAGREILLEHYDSRLKIVLGHGGHQVARRLLTEAAANEGWLRGDDIPRYREHFAGRTEDEPGSTQIEDVLHVLEHDGYLGKERDGYRFVSGLLEDWWRVRYVWRGVSPPSLSAASARQTA